MAIGAKHDAFIQLGFNSFPTPGVPFVGNAKILLCRIPMMKLKRLNAAIVSATFTPAALITDCQSANLFSSLMNSLYQALFSIAVCSLVFLHRLL